MTKEHEGKLTLQSKKKDPSGSACKVAWVVYTLPRVRSSVNIGSGQVSIEHITSKIFVNGGQCDLNIIDANSKVSANLGVGQLNLMFHSKPHKNLLIDCNMGSGDILIRAPESTTLNTFGVSKPPFTVQESHALKISTKNPHIVLRGSLASGSIRSQAQPS